MDDDTAVGGEQASDAQLPADRLTASHRRFFPCNREDALLLLGGLCISHWFPESTVRLPVDDSGVVVVPDGLRGEEGLLVCGTQSERFPLLIEIVGDPDPALPRIIRIVDVLRLVFRTQDEADAFRFRPVEEFDPVDLAWSVEPALFGLPGAPRFRLRDPDGSALETGRLVDRVVAAVFTLLAVGNQHETCRPSIRGFVSGSSPEEVQPSPDLKTLLRHLSQGVPRPAAQLVDAVLAAFAGAESQAPRTIIESMGRAFDALMKPEDRAGEVAGRWLDVARDVARSRFELNGDLLSDEKSILLRAALLGAFADDDRAVLAFLQGEKPAGLRVATTGSFLVGLKVGVIGDSWGRKRYSVDKLSAATAAFLRAWPDVASDSAPLLHVDERRGDSEIVNRFLVGDVALAEWTSPLELDLDEKAWLGELSLAGYAVLGSGATPRSWQVRMPSTGRTLEIMQAEAGSPPRKFPVLRFRFADGEKLKKAKEIATSFESGGRLWAAHQDPASGWFLSCELPSLPVGDDMRLVADTLEAAVQLCVAPAKAPRKARPKAAAVKATSATGADS